MVDSMVHLWAFRVGAWIPGGHWSRVVQMNGFRDLTATFRATLVKHGTISRLGIVAHGDQVGVVQLDPTLSVASLPRVRTDLVELGRFLTPRAFIELYACVAGGESEGRALLTGLSRILPGRTFVGFEVNGGVGNWSARNTAGMVNATFGGTHIIPGDYLSPHHRHARWARDGAIVRESMFDRDARHRCGSPTCPGHASELHHCRGWPATGLAEAELRR